MDKKVLISFSHFSTSDILNLSPFPMYVLNFSHLNSHAGAAMRIIVSTPVKIAQYFPRSI